MTLFFAFIIALLVIALLVLGVIADRRNPEFKARHKR